jgi:hypothetical protein
MNSSSNGPRRHRGHPSRRLARCRPRPPLHSPRPRQRPRQRPYHHRPLSPQACNPCRHSALPRRVAFAWLRRPPLSRQRPCSRIRYGPDRTGALVVGLSHRRPRSLLMAARRFARCYRSLWRPWSGPASRRRWIARRSGTSRRRRCEAGNNARGLTPLVARARPGSASAVGRLQIHGRCAPCAARGAEIVLLPSCARSLR